MGKKKVEKQRQILEKQEKALQVGRLFKKRK
jgi:hypothetical protein